MKMRVFYQIALFGAAVSFLSFVWFTFSAKHDTAGILLVAAFLLLAVGVKLHPVAARFSYTICVFGAVTLALYFPQYFQYIGEMRFSSLTIPLLQITMFGMGTVLGVNDFAELVKRPKTVLIGMACQFLIMPFLGFFIAHIFSFPREIAAGIILIGCVPSGLASNVMAYLAKANLALSVCITSLATLLAPLVTPLLMKLLGGEFVQIDFWTMVWDITKIVILPIAVGVLFNYFLRNKFEWIKRVMPLISMASILLIVVIIMASGRNSLLQVGWLLILAVLLHNLAGYFVGYWVSRLMRFSEEDCRTISIEVGMQNGGLASGLALGLGKMATMGLAPAIFSSVMNVTGSALASWWHGRTKHL